MVAHDHLRSAGVLHLPHQRDDLDLLVTAVDEITYEHRPSLRMPPRPAARFVAHLREEPNERVILAGYSSPKHIEVCVVGLRKFKNPKFDRFTWDVKKYLADPATVEPPYLIGMTCGFCHIGFNPVYPPTDPENPRWYNFSSAIGNQYFKEGTLFGLKLPPQDFRWHVANRQPAGTSDTSRFATDHIFNPNAINSIVYLANRPGHSETT